MTPERGRGLAVGGLLTSAEVEAIERFKWAYHFTSVTEGALCMRDAERIVDRLRFVRWRRAKEQARS